MSYIAKEDTYAYRGQQARLFTEGQEVPDGWADAPEVPYAAEGEHDWVVEEFHTPKRERQQAAMARTAVAHPGALDEPIKRGPGRPPKITSALDAVLTPEGED